MTYRLESMAHYWLYVAILPCLFVATGVGWIYLATAYPQADQSGPPAWLGVLWLAWVVWGIKRYVTMPHTIVWTNEGRIHFVGTFVTTIVTASDVASVKSFAGQFVYVTHARGKILLLQQFTGFHEFLTHLKHANTQVSMHGV